MFAYSKSPTAYEANPVPPLARRIPVTIVVRLTPPAAIAVPVDVTGQVRSALVVTVLALPVVEPDEPAIAA